MEQFDTIIDYKTDAVTQSSLRNQFNFKGDVTYTVALRLQTIMNVDKIMSDFNVQNELADKTLMNPGLQKNC